MRFADPDNIPSEIAATGGERGLGLFQEAEKLTLTDQVGRVQRAWQELVPRLLIFDNCESQALLEQWRPVTGGCRILLTSRRAEWSRELNLTCLPLDVLSRSESAHLLQSLAPDLGQTHADEIAAEVGDLPLALHLAGSFLARYHQISPAVYLDQLRNKSLFEHPSLQGRGSSLSPTGHEMNVVRTYALSWERLNPADEVDSTARQLLACAACLAPAEPIPAEWLKTLVCADGDDLTTTLLAEDGLSRLVTLGFLKREAGQTVILHPLLASFTQGASGEEEFGAAHRLVTSSLTQKISEHFQKKGHLSILPISVVHVRYVSQEALARKTPIAATLATLLGVHLLNVGESLEAEQTLGSAYTAAREIEDVHSQARVLSTLARVQESMGRYNESLDSAQQAVSLFKETGGSDPAGLVDALYHQGRVLHRLEQAQAALSAAGEGYALSQNMNFRQAEARFLDLMGVVNYYQMAHYELAQQQLEKGLAIYRELGNRQGESSILNHMGENARLQGDYSPAAGYYEAALSIAREIENHDDANLILSNLCGARVGLGQFETAATDLQELISGIKHNWHGLFESYRFLGEAYLGQDKVAQAFAMAQQSLALANPSNLVDTGRTWRFLGRVAAQLDETVRSGVEDEQTYDTRACFRHSLDLFKQGKSERDRAITLWRWAQVECEQGDKEQAGAMWQEARDIFTRLNLPLMVARMEVDANKE